MGYNKYLVLSCIAGASTQWLIKKYQSTGVATDMVLVKIDQQAKFSRVPKEDQLKISALSGDACIVFHAHGAKGSGELGDENNVTTTDLQLVQLLADNLMAANITKLRINLVCCYAGAPSSKYREDSLAERLLDKLMPLGIKNLEVVASPDLVSIKEHPTTGKIIIFFETNLETSIRDQYKLKRLEILNEIKSDFIWGYMSLKIPLWLENYIGFFSRTNLAPESLMDLKKLNDFLGQLCEFMLHQLYLSNSAAEFLMPVFFALGVIKGRLITDATKRQGLAMDETFKQIKQANHSRAGAKLLFSYKEGTKEVADCYRSKSSYRKFSSRGD